MYHSVMIEETRGHYLSMPGDECQLEGSDDSIDMEGCHLDYFERLQNCSIPWRKGRNEKVSKCYSTSQFDAFRFYSRDLAQKDEQKIYELNGCRKACKRRQYKAWSSFTTRRYNTYERSHVRIWNSDKVSLQLHDLFISVKFGYFL